MYTYSVIIPTLNEEKNVENLITQIHKQTIQPKEIILADKSTDKTPQIAKKLGAIIVEGVDNFKLGKAKNNGAKVSTADILFFFDADMQLPHNRYFENFLIAYEKNKLDAAHATLVPNNNTLRNRVGYNIYNFIRYFGIIINSIISDAGSGISVKKDVFNKIGGFREDIVNSEDVLLLDSIVKTGYKYKILKERIIIDDRRIKNKSLFVILLLAVMIPFELYLKRRGYNNRNSRYLDLFSKIYQMNRFDIKKLKSKFQYKRV